jgi:phosphoglycerol transferase MdoB-like AlkP superfamily enzyme
MVPGQPIALTAIALVVATLVILATDRLALSPGLRVAAAQASPRRASDLLARVVAILPVFAFFFAISWRPLYSAGGTISFFVIFTAISRAKLQFVREPLVFADIALLALVFRHKELFSATWLDAIFFVGAATYVFGASTLFYLFEPSILPASAGWLPVVGMVAAALLPWFVLFVAPVRETAARIAGRIMQGDAPVAVTWRLGTFGSVIYSFLEWLGGREPEPQLPLPARLASVGASPLVVVWQSESFYDMRHFGLPVSLPNLDRLRRRSAAWGRMSSVFEGGYTLRTEFAVLSGMSPAALGPDSHYPYLRPLRFAGSAWPDRFRRSDWATHFLHPYDRRFFSRDTALPAMGFETLTMLDAFAHDPARDGQYVSDMALTRRVIDAARDGGHRAGTFLFAASMENHGPWKPGRLDGRTNPVDIYTAILERSDAALGHLVDTLDGWDRPVWLIFYGDHAPILKSFADPFPDPRTDYVIAPLGASARPSATPPASEIAPWQLIETLVSHMHAPGPARRSA